MKNRFILILLLSLTFAVNAQFSDLRDGRLIEDSKGRFIGDIKVLGVRNRTTIDAADKTNFLNEFTLKMKVWDYLGEPLEMYAFQWYRKGYYTVKVDNTSRSMSLDQLLEYPDLQKRFLDIRPTKVDIKIFGYAGDGNSSDKNRVGKIKVEESSVPVNVVYTYIVKDVDLLIAREGEFREPTVAGSPPTWNEFFNWQYSDPKGPLIDLNVTEDSFKRLSQEEQKQRITKIKNIWKQVKQISVSASIETLEWPEYEMIDIIKTYDRYKNEKKELSPQEKLEAELAEVQRTTEYNRNDEWGELPDLVEPEIEVFSIPKPNNEYGNYYGLKYKGTELVVLEPTNIYITKIADHFIVNNGKFNSKDAYKAERTYDYVNNATLYNNKGEQVGNRNYASIKFLKKGKKSIYDLPKNKILPENAIFYCTYPIGTPFKFYNCEGCSPELYGVNKQGIVGYDSDGNIILEIVLDKSDRPFPNENKPFSVVSGLINRYSDF
ncbi:hypothetical protein ADIWIN_2953 [Winogradskyella psychrotolerans RS-3]|uniref:Uncharacterized protein n=1 Tax=Winogradskyella psychrotolerans RS-3 TaxID=641526 RepID=S7WZB0_9FLAO|nr:hypothetical protein [Winogradskyella psychrotolerans]EPR72114.1 hypothetical protein ADIWIN_2953 [Winogradskyella psychrotolerans RS-3]